MTEKKRTAKKMFTRAEMEEILKRIDLRVTDALDAKPLAYLDSQRVTSIHNRVGKIDEMLTVDAHQRQIWQGRLQMAEERQVIEAKNLATFIGLGFWARFRWLFFGAKGILQAWPVRETKTFDDVFRGGNEG